MTWAKLDDQFFRHPKACAAGAEGRLLYLAGLCYSSGMLTDGRIPTGALPLIAVEAGVDPQAVDKVVESGLWETIEGGWMIHDFLDWNPSAAKVRDLRSKRAEAGRLGGSRSKPKAHGEANAEASAQANGEADAKQESKQTGKQTPKQTPKQIGSEIEPRPRPYLDISQSSSGNSRGADAAPPPAADDDDLDPRVGEAIGILAEWDLADRRRATHLPRVRDPRGFKRTAARRRVEQDGPRLIELAAQHPELAASALAEAICPPPAATPADPDAEAQAAFRERVERNGARAAAEAATPPASPEVAAQGAAAARKALRHKPGSPSTTTKRRESR